MSSKISRKMNFLIILILVLTFLFLSSCNTKSENKKKKHNDARDKNIVEVVFVPYEQDVEITDGDMEIAKSVIEARLVNNNITDYKVLTDTRKNQITISFPQKSSDSDFYVQEIIEDLNDTALVKFCVGENDTDVILESTKDIKSAQAIFDQDTGVPMVLLKLTEEGSAKFATATAQYQGQVISIWMDDEMISAPTVNDVITNGEAIISSDTMTSDDATELANKINAGTLPFSLALKYCNLPTSSGSLYY